MFTKEVDVSSGIACLSWSSHIAKWKSSGLSQAAYCRSNNLKYHAFIYWRRKYESRTSPGEGTERFVEIASDFPMMASAGLGDIRGGVRFWLGDFCIEVDENFSLSLLSKLIPALRRL